MNDGNPICVCLMSMAECELRAFMSAVDGSYPRIGNSRMETDHDCGSRATCASSRKPDN
jgi:hypothetical protein